MHDKVPPSPTFAALWELIETLRGENGCPWDRKQTPQTLTVYLIEETFELVEAIAADDSAAIQEELGDVLFQVMFLLYMFHQQGRFEPTDVLGQNVRKMIHRHPHVFGADKVETAGEVKKRWAEIKQLEKGAGGGSLMDSVPAGLPALLRAYRISERAAGIGFDWDKVEGVMAQAEAEWEEFRTELNADQQEAAANRNRVEEEFGDVLFTLINVARLARIHPETALTRSTLKFIRRFKKMEAMAGEQGRSLKEVERQEMEQFWRAIKAEE